VRRTQTRNNSKKTDPDTGPEFNQSKIAVLACEQENHQKDEDQHQYIFNAIKQRHISLPKGVTRFL